MEFFVDNWLWFLIVAVVVLMTLIGYIAEKTDFGRNDIPKREKVKKEKVKKIKNKQEKQDITEIEAMPEVQMSLATDAILEEPKAEEQVEDLNIQVGDISFEEPNLDNVEELSTSFDNVPFETTDVENVNEMDTVEDLNVPFGDMSFETPMSEVEEVIEEIPTEELNFNELNMPSMELPDLDTIVNEADDSDDVWKF